MDANMLKANDLLLESQEQNHIFQQFTKDIVAMSAKEIFNDTNDASNNDQYGETEIKNISFSENVKISFTHHH